MRFVVGLCFGALLVLTAAALLDWPGTQLQPPAVTNVDLDSDDHFAQKPSSVAPPPLVDQTPIETAVPALKPVEPTSATEWPAVAESVTAPLVISDAAMAPDAHAAAEQTEIAMDETSAPPTDWIAKDFPATDAVTATTTDSAEVEAEDYSFAEPTAQVAVWRPFHSQMSAEGFAKRLSLQLGYPFSVVKTGAARYHVVFSYEDTAERDLLAEQLTALTGYTPNDG